MFFLLIGVVIVAVALSTLAWPWSGKTNASRSRIDTSIADQQLAFFGPGFRPRTGGSFGLDRLAIHRSELTPFSYYGEVTFPADSSSVRASKAGDGTVVGGTQLYLEDVTGPKDRAFLRYYVRIPAGFDWVKGGKLPGLYGGSVTSGRKIPDGANGLSTRYMWRAGGAAEVYAYLPTSKLHGTSLGRGNWSWPTGRWTCIEQEVSLNEPGKSDGSVNVWLDSRQVLSQHDLTFRTSHQLKVDGLFFSTFFGGGDKSWATPTAQQIEFAGFKIGDSRIGC